MLSENIKTLRKQKGYSQEQLADKLNVVRQTVSKWEKGYSVPDADMLEELADIFEVSVGDLLGKEIMTEEETTDIGELVKQLKILNDYFSEKVRRKKKSHKILKGFCSIISIIVILFSIFLASVTAVNIWRENFRKEVSTTLICTLEDKEYNVDIRYWENNNKINSVGWSSSIPKAVDDILRNDVLNRKPEELVEQIQTYFIENGGSCELAYEDKK